LEIFVGFQSLAIVKKTNELKMKVVATASFFIQTEINSLLSGLRDFS
jgi:hypothetical protein